MNRLAEGYAPSAKTNPVSPGHPWWGRGTVPPVQSWREPGM